MSFLANLGYILLGFIGIVSVFLIILAILEKKLHIRFIRGQYARNEQYLEKISKIDVKNPVNALQSLGKISKFFFSEAFHVKGSPEFSSLEDFFKKKNNKKAREFCEKMTAYLYSHEEITKEKLQNLITLLAEIISKNKIITPQRKEELDAKSQKLDPIKRINIPIVKKQITYEKKQKNKKPKRGFSPPK